MNKPRRDWSTYQVDKEPYDGPKSVSDLTEAEAKDELCMAMDLIQVLREIIDDSHEKSLDAIRRTGY